MTVSEWVDKNMFLHPRRQIRMINAETHKGYGCHWIAFKDYEVDHTKITSQWVFIYI